MNHFTSLLTDPLRFKDLCWPEVRFYDRQVDVIMSVIQNRCTIVSAGNDLGKDFVAAFIAVWWICSRKPAKCIASSVDSSQLKGVLWGEMKRFIRTSRYPLPLECLDSMEIYQLDPSGARSELGPHFEGRVVKQGEGLLGRHIATRDKWLDPRTLFIADEASGVGDLVWENADTWAHRKLAIGNPWPCANFFRRAVKQGDVAA